MQIVGYETGAGTDAGPALVLAEDRSTTRESLPVGRDLRYRLGERRCAGHIDGETHEPCSETQAPYCETHTSTWACARCTGECSLPLETCREEHVVYLAAFAPDTFKVGVTRSWRLETRLREQGADRAAHLRTVADGRTARRIEADIATEVGDRVRVRTKVRGLHRTVDDEAWQRCLADFEPIATYEFAYDAALDDRPVVETIAAGTVVGTKGRVLLLGTAGSTYAVDMRDLVGYEVTAGDPDRSLQSNLDAFE
ncbi:MAG: DUF2797 domain-containing protein [Halovenus sp.]